MAQRFESFDEFWTFYVRAHSKKSTRVLHFVGTSLGVGSAALGLMSGRLALLAAAPVLGYLPAWVGHFVFEGNIPATFGNPLWSLKADFVMFSKMVNGTMDAEVERVMRAAREGNGTHQPDGDSIPPINVSYEPSDPLN